MNRFQKWTQRRVSLPVKLLAVLLAGGLFVFLIPYTQLVLCPRPDSGIDLPDFRIGWVKILACAILVMIGGYYAFSSIYQQLFNADGTPLPFIPTKKLPVNSVFQQSGNPMTFGTICLDLGLAILAGSLFALLMVAVFFAFLLVYTSSGSRNMSWNFALVNLTWSTKRTTRSLFRASDPKDQTNLTKMKCENRL